MQARSTLPSQALAGRRAWVGCSPLGRIAWALAVGGAGADIAAVVEAGGAGAPARRMPSMLSVLQSTVKPAACWQQARHNIRPTFRAAE